MCSWVWVLITWSTIQQADSYLVGNTFRKSVVLISFHILKLLLLSPLCSPWLPSPSWRDKCCLTTLQLIRPKTLQTAHCSTSTRSSHSCMLYTSLYTLFFLWSPHLSMMKYLAKWYILVRSATIRSNYYQKPLIYKVTELNINYKSVLNMYIRIL